jgi:putative transposase
LRRLREQRTREIDEAALFRAVAELRDIEKAAAATTRSARRNRNRRAVHMLPTVSQDPVAVAAHKEEPFQPFEEIEPW